MEIRNIKDEDSKSIFKWRNNQETREMSFKTKKVSLKEHNKWFKESIQNSNRKFLIGESNGTKIGICRFDFDEENFSSEVSINMNPEVRGKGFGKKFLSNAIRIYLDEKRCILKAKIKEDNNISIRLFFNVGFLTTKKENGFIYMELKF